MKIDYRKEGERTQFRSLGVVVDWPAVGRMQIGETESFTVHLRMERNVDDSPNGPCLRFAMSRGEAESLVARLTTMLAGGKP
jgi:hypothetical protein